MRLFYACVALFVFYPTIDSYDVSIEIATATECGNKTSPCYIHCNKANEYAVIQTLYCNHAETCTIHCTSIACMKHSIIHAEHVKSLKIVSSATHCLFNSTIYLPANGSVIIHAHSAAYAFSSNALYSGLSTSSIKILCINSYDKYIDNICDDLSLNASTAHDLYVDIAYTSARRAYINCPTAPDSSCVIDAADAISIQGTTIVATHEVTIYTGNNTNTSQTMVQCNDMITRYYSMTQYFSDIQCAIYQHTSLPISTISKEVDSRHRNLLQMFLSLPYTIYACFILFAVIICICCVMCCTKCGCKCIAKTGTRIARTRTITSGAVRRVLSSGSIVEDVKRMLELASSTPQTMATDTISKQEFTPHVLHSNSDMDLDTIDIVSVGRDDDVHVMSHMMPFSAPVNQVKIVECGKNADVDTIYNQIQTRTTRDDSVADEDNDIKVDKSKRKGKKIKEYLKFRKRPKSESGHKPKSLSERGFTVNRLYGIYSQNASQRVSINEEEEDDDDDDDDAEEKKQDNDDNVSEASTFTLGSDDAARELEIEESTFTVRDNAIGTLAADGVDFDQINTLHEDECEREEDSDDDEEYDGVKKISLNVDIISDHVRTQTEGTETATSLRLPPKMTPGSYL